MKSPDAQLAIPSSAYQDSFIAAVDEFIQDGYVGFWAPRALIDNFDEYLQMLHEKATHPLPGYVASTRYWLVAPDAGYVGELDLRHELSASLRRYGGHIGYDIRPFDAAARLREADMPAGHRGGAGARHRRYSHHLR